MHWLHDISAVLPTNGEPVERDPALVDTIVLHCTAMADWNVWDTARYHTGPNHISADGCPTIAYAYFVERDGLLYRTLPHDVRAWHAGPWNERSIGVCMAYEAGDDPPPPAQLATAAEICAHLVRTLGLDEERVMGHRELEGTGYVIENGEIVQRKECPGRAVDMDRFRRTVATILARPGGPEVREA
jgi:N-acetyl-anhydromuramyl-L-alanine amidase AmpD